MLSSVLSNNSLLFSLCCLLLFVLGQIIIIKIIYNKKGAGNSILAGLQITKFYPCNPSLSASPTPPCTMGRPSIPKCHMNAKCYYNPNVDSRGGESQPRVGTTRPLHHTAPNRPHFIGKMLFESHRLLTHTMATSKKSFYICPGEEGQQCLRWG